MAAHPRRDAALPPYRSVTLWDRGQLELPLAGGVGGRVAPRRGAVEGGKAPPRMQFVSGENRQLELLLHK